MAHNLATIAGKIAMAYKGEKPWHGLGTAVEQFDDVDDMLAAANLNWNVRKVAIFSKENKIVTGLYGLERDIDKEILTVVGKRYVPTQNREALNFMSKFVAKGDMHLETAGALDGGRYVWGLAKLRNGFTLPGGDAVHGHLLIAIPHKMGYAIQMRFTATRVVCENTLSMALGEGRAAFSMPHLSVFDEKAYSKAEEALGLSEEKMTQFQRNAETLAKIKLGADDTIRLLAKIFQPDDKVEDILKGKVAQGRKLKQILESIESAPGAQLETAKGTAWGVLNGLTFLDSHGDAKRNDSRMMSTWFGQNATTTNKLFNNLLQLAD
jgi:phage/plasmid-like protein (TIGR03299 family)